MKKLKRRSKAYVKKKHEEEEREKKKETYPSKDKEEELPPRVASTEEQANDADVHQSMDQQPRMVTTTREEAEVTAVQAEVPPSVGPWETYYDSYGRPYYHNPSTGTTQWEKPSELA